MNKKKILINLIIFQGLLIAIGLIIVIYTIITKLDVSLKDNYKLPENINSKNVFLFDENHIQHKILIDNKIVFEIINLETLKKVNTVSINED